MEVARNAAEVQWMLQKRPFFRLQQFAARLGWRGLRMEHIWLREQDGNLPSGGVIVWYETTDVRFHIQINEEPCGQWETHSATVIAERFRLVPTPFQDFQLGSDDQQLQAEAARLGPFLARANFKNKAWRDQLLRKHPERFYPKGWSMWKWK